MKLVYEQDDEYFNKERAIEIIADEIKYFYEMIVPVDYTPIEHYENHKEALEDLEK